MSELIKYRIILDFDNYDLPLIEISKLMDSLSIKSNIALYFSRAIVPNTEIVLNEYINKYKVNVLKKKGYEKSDFIVIFENIKSNTELLELMKQHGLNLYYINAKSYENFSNIETIFKEKFNPKIEIKLHELIQYEILIYFDIDRTIEIIFNSISFNKEEIYGLLLNWLKSIKVQGFNIEELK
ncbi:hypothetical protein [Haploplasma modicum]|uniref:hypothetical protein n=1 Tax=Haploplasma modicum TaxID=2150 RepID=UPI00047B8F94|nr:hypothetical protein [Haploplasma modicum]